MCLQCHHRWLSEALQVEQAIVLTGGAAVRCVEAVYHQRPHQGMRARSEGHCHLRVRRTDGSCGEWAIVGGGVQHLERCVRKMCVALDVVRFASVDEANERGLDAKTLAALRSKATCVVDKSDCAGGCGCGADCPICLEPLDCSATPGGFAKVSAQPLPCGHTFHTACVVPWFAKHTTCPNCREEVTADAVAAMPTPPPAEAAPATDPAPETVEPRAAQAPKKKKKKNGSVFSRLRTAFAGGPRAVSPAG